jgi:hypothetical protein
MKSYGRRRREYPVILGLPEFSHLSVVQLLSPGDADEWLSEV